MRLLISLFLLANAAVLSAQGAGTISPGMSRAKVYTLMGSGELPFAKIGKCRRVPWAALEKLVAKNLVGVN